jgi:hypothetical protein
MWIEYQNETPVKWLFFHFGIWSTRVNKDRGIKHIIA